MKNILKYTLSAGAILTMSAVSASADTNNTFVNQEVTASTSFVGTNLSSKAANQVADNATDRTNVDKVLRELNIDPNDVDVSSMTSITDKDQLNQINSNIPDWAQNIIKEGGKIGYLELEIYPAEAPAIYPPIIPEPRIEKVYYQITAPITDDGNNKPKTTADILKEFGVNASELPPIGQQRWPLADGEKLVIPYWVDSNETIRTKDGNQKFATLVDDAIKQWNTQLAGVSAPIRFEKTNNKNNAMYRFELGSDSTVVAGQALRGLSGRTTMYVDNTSDLYLKDYGIDTYINKNSISKNYDKTQTTNVIAHEIGHSIGLEHTSDQNDLMYTAPQNQTLRKVDAVAALIMYTSENEPGRGSKQIFG